MRENYENTRQIKAQVAESTLRNCVSEWKTYV
jgi:hypothetical protein